MKIPRAILRLAEVGRLGFDGALVYYLLVMAANEGGAIEEWRVRELVPCKPGELDTLLDHMVAVGLIYRYAEQTFRPMVSLTRDWNSDFRPSPAPDPPEYD